MDTCISIVGLPNKIRIPLTRAFGSFLEPGEFLGPTNLTISEFSQDIFSVRFGEVLLKKYPDRLKNRRDKKFFKSVLMIFVPSNYNQITNPDLLFNYVHYVKVDFNDFSQLKRSIAVSRLRQIFVSEVRKIRKVLNGLYRQIVECDAKTPLLLPFRNFKNSNLIPLVTRIQSELSESDDAQIAIKKYIELSIRKFNITRENRCTTFIDNRNVMFKAPCKAGARHGEQRSGDSHTQLCFWHANLRLGIPYGTGFHYDCRSLHGESTNGMFETCHEPSTHFSGNPHLNIYPNDYIRK